MGKVIDVEAELAKDNRANPRATQTALAILADALRVYAEAAANVEKHGAIVAHPRTAQPIENPYLRIMQQQGKTLERARGFKTDRVFRLLREQSRKPTGTKGTP
jgi:phage terminase small subunit